MQRRRSASLPLILAALATVAGCDGTLPDVAPRCVPARAMDAAPAEARSPESVAATLLTASPSHLLLRADESSAIVDADGLLFVLPASEKRPTKEALTAASVGKDSIFSKPELETLERNGALVVPAPTGQRYRVITYGLLHNGLDHLMNNGLALYIGSLLLEPAIGAARTILVFVGGVLAAGAARLLSRRPCVMTGASGGTFALKGAALALVLLPAAWVPTLARADFLILLGVMLGMGLLLSFLPTISLLGHAAGAAAGALLAISGVVTLAHPPLDGGAESPLARVVTWTIALVALAVWMAAGLYARRRVPPP